jgi:hypothetical protein
MMNQDEARQHLIVKPTSVYRLNWLLGRFDAGVIDKDTLDQFLRR